MAFGSDLQGWPSHKALVGLQDTEICLLEVMKKCIVHRIKTDREYCTALSELVTITHKLDVVEFATPLSQVNCMIQANITNPASFSVRLTSENTSYKTPLKVIYS